MKVVYAVFIGFIVVGIMACSSGTVTKVAKENDPIKGQMSQLDKETKLIIGSADCTFDKQCRSIGFGHKPCGGFYAYRIYSDKNTDVAQLEKKVSQYNALSRELNKKNNLVSNCMMLMPPRLVCRKQSCQIK